MPNDDDEATRALDAALRLARTYFVDGDKLCAGLVLQRLSVEMIRAVLGAREVPHAPVLDSEQLERTAHLRELVGSSNPVRLYVTPTKKGPPGFWDLWLLTEGDAAREYLFSCTPEISTVVQRFFKFCHRSLKLGPPEFGPARAVEVKLSPPLMKAAGITDDNLESLRPFSEPPQAPGSLQRIGPFLEGKEPVRYEYEDEDEPSERETEPPPAPEFPTEAEA